MAAGETQVTSVPRQVASPSPGSPVTLAVREHGSPASTTHVVAMHGFPDDQRMWDPVVAALPADWHVVTYDSRGVGGSSRPPHRDGFRLHHHVDDLAAVVAATVPDGAAVHLLAHDWGSIAAWDVVAAAATRDPRLEGRLASFTSVSGPSLDHLTTRTAGLRGFARMLPQLLHSWYVWFFCLPRLPELTWRRLQRPVRRSLRRLDPTLDLLPWGRDLARDAVPALEIYRANVVRRLRGRGGRAAWRTSVPVLLVVALRDGFVLPLSVDGLEARCRDLTRVELDEGHWVPRARPEELARLVADHVGAHPA